MVVNTQVAGGWWSNSVMIRKRLALKYAGFNYLETGFRPWLCAIVLVTYVTRKSIIKKLGGVEKIKINSLS